jgi:hypothetical protein
MIHFIDMFALPVYAQCPVCVVTVGGGLFIAKKLGIDDLLVSIWLSSLNTALAFWFASFMKNKILKNGFGWTIAFYILTVGTLFFTKQIGVRYNTLLGIDKTFLGITLGSIISLGAIMVDRIMRLKNKGKVLFPYQKVIIPLVTLTLTTLIFMFVIKFIKR